MERTRARSKGESGIVIIVVAVVVVGSTLTRIVVLPRGGLEGGRVVQGVRMAVVQPSKVPGVVERRRADRMGESTSSVRGVWRGGGD